MKTVDQSFNFYPAVTDRFFARITVRYEDAIGSSAVYCIKQ